MFTDTLPETVSPIHYNNVKLLIKNTSLDMDVAQGNRSLHHAILSNSGNVTPEGAKITCAAFGVLFYLKKKKAQ